MSSRLRVVSIVGTRPNFMKMAPVVAELQRRAEMFEPLLVHTGQHYDEEMSEVFLQELGIPEPHRSLGVGSGSHAQQTARVMERLERVLLETQPDLVIVPGDVNSTLAAALVCAKLQVPLAHVESGLRSFDRSMPEEINRVVADQLTDLLFTHSPEAAGNLLAEGVQADRIHYVGNTMIDTLVALRDRIERAAAPERLGLLPGSYLLVTLHRPALVDGPALAETVINLERLSAELPVVFPVHPRTRQAIARLGMTVRSHGLRLLEPLGYLDFMSLVMSAAAVLTDSGGVQEETTYLGIPCFTLRDNTERPITTDIGTNSLLGQTPARIAEIPDLIDGDPMSPAAVPELWDGQAARRLVEVLAQELAGGFFNAPAEPTPLFAEMGGTT